VLSTADNEILTRIGPGTMMGNLLRRYWMPVSLVTELPETGGAPVRVRLLGENLILFRDISGRIGLVDEACPHRSASLYYGRNEAGPGGTCGVRCLYHGWQFDVEGNCIDAPNEPNSESFKRRIKLTAYPVHLSGGMVWAYLGPPDQITPFRDFGTEELLDGEVFVSKQLTTCNWVQVLEGNIDTAHISFLHQFDGVDDLPDDGSDKPGYPANSMSWRFWKYDRSPRLEVQDDWYGFRYAGMRTTPNGYTDTRVSAWCFPNTNMTANIPFSTRQTMVVPIDDENTFRYTFATRGPSNPRDLGGRAMYSFVPFDNPISNGSGILPRQYTAENEYGLDREVQRGSTFSGVPDFGSQDYLVTESAGRIIDRSREHLGTTDVAVIRMRRLLLSAAKALAAGGEPPAVGPADYAAIRGAEKVLAEGEDWRELGTPEDPVVQEAAQALAESRGRAAG
jgi:phthalate 4,5-dioxygenase